MSSNVPEICHCETRHPYMGCQHSKYSPVDGHQSYGRDCVKLLGSSITGSCSDCIRQRSAIGSLLSGTPALRPSAPTTERRRRRPEETSHSRHASPAPLQRQAPRQPPTSSLLQTPSQTLSGSTTGATTSSTTATRSKRYLVESSSSSSASPKPDRPPPAKRSQGASSSFTQPSRQRSEMEPWRGSADIPLWGRPASPHGRPTQLRSFFEGPPPLTPEAIRAQKVEESTRTGDELRNAALSSQHDAPTSSRRAAPPPRGPRYAEADEIFRVGRGYEQHERDHPNPAVRLARQRRDRRAETARQLLAKKKAEGKPPR